MFIRKVNLGSIRQTVNHLLLVRLDEVLQVFLDVCSDPIRQEGAHFARGLGSFCKALNQSIEDSPADFKSLALVVGDAPIDHRDEVCEFMAEVQHYTCMLKGREKLRALGRY